MSNLVVVGPVKSSQLGWEVAFCVALGESALLGGVEVGLWAWGFGG